jgi:hypothetical protein
MKLQDVLRWSAVLAVVSIIISPFQNCSDVAFTPAPSESLLSEPVAGKQSCVDQDGNPRAHGDHWSSDQERSEALPCPDAPARSQRYVDSQQFICEDGSVRPTDFASFPLDIVPECPAPAIEAKIAPTLPAEGSSAELIVKTQYLSSVNFACAATYPSANAFAASGALKPGEDKTAFVVSEDITCKVQGTNSAGVKVVAEAQVQVNCGNRMKENGRCREFECKEVVPLTLGADFVVPARTPNGICYSIKLLNAIANSSSSLTTVRDPEVLTRSHDSANRGQTHEAYLLGKASLRFNLAGPRTVKLSGSGTSPAPIKVDNFVVAGLYPAIDGVQPDTGFYRAHGTADAMITGTNHVLVRSSPVTLTPFGPSGTSTIAPLDITADVVPGQMFELDLRALDCGGSRELSEIYLLFQ